MERKEILDRIDELLEKAYQTPDLGNQKDPLDELIYITLCTRSGPKNVARAFANLKRDFPNWSDVLEAPDDQVEKSLRVLGTARKKAETVKEILAEIQNRHQVLDLGFLRDIRDDDRVYYGLRFFPHVGPKVAHCVMLFSLDRDVLPVDTHVHRILKRLGLVPANSKAEDASNEIQADVPRGSAYRLHVNLVTHGRQKCRAYSPKCTECEIESYCAYAGHHILDNC